MKTWTCTQLGKVDLRKCRKGDKLVSVHGWILTYVSHIPSAPYPHIVKYDGEDQCDGSRLDDGRVYAKNRSPEDHDIIAVLARPKRKAVRK